MSFWYLYSQCFIYFATVNTHTIRLLRAAFTRIFYVNNFEHNLTPIASLDSTRLDSIWMSAISGKYVKTWQQLNKESKKNEKGKPAGDSSKEENILHTYYLIGFWINDQRQNKKSVSVQKDIFEPMQWVFTYLKTISACVIFLLYLLELEKCNFVLFAHSLSLFRSTFNFVQVFECQS